MNNDEIRMTKEVRMSKDPMPLGHRNRAGFVIRPWNILSSLVIGHSTLFLVPLLLTLAIIPRTTHL
ncbi:MAG: hypothetical protein HY735_33970 [Verrucomicrobia bacterium]|nr:hypothetical protein [Verrucomicrobiota bacterium]